MFLSIIIPCYNEEKRIPKTLERINSYLSTKAYEYEIIVVDNGSSDNTEEVVERMKPDIAALKVIGRKEYGKGWAVKQGMIEAKGDYRLFTDADNSTDISHIDTLLPFAEQGFDLVISSRKVAGAKITHPQPKFRIFLGNMFVFTVGLIVPVGIKDTQNGFKLFSKKAAEKLFPLQTIYYWAFDVEILALARKFKYKVKEVPITWINDDRSKMNIKGMISMLFEVIKVRINLLTGKYNS